MATITISKKEYRELLEKKMRYEYLRFIIDGDIFASPPIRNKRKIIDSFRATKRYNRKFLSSLKRGLERSTHFSS